MCRPILFSVALLLVSAGCGRSNGDASSTSGTLAPPKRPTSTARLAMISPQTGAAYPPTSVPVKVGLTGGKLLLQASANLTPDTGHIHLELDGQTITLLAGLESDVAQVLGKPLDPGPHLLQVEFAAADHLPFNPRVIVAVPFTVK
jgi:hypothetical protein